MADLKTVLDGEEGSESYENPEEYDALAKELGEVLSLPESKAQQLRDVICALARQEMEGGTEEMDEEMGEGMGEGMKGPKGKNLAMILG